MNRHGGQDLVRRLRTLQQRRHDLTQAKDHGGAHAALDLAVSLVDPCDLPTLREALLHATNPASVPVVLGPQDVAAVVGRDEVLALVAIYAEAVITHAKRPTPESGRLCWSTHAAISEALGLLCRAVPTYELGGGRT